MIENAQNHQICSCKRPQYHFSLGFMMVYINICSMLVSQINIYLDRTHNDVNWSQFDVENDQNWQFCTFSIIFDVKLMSIDVSMCAI